MQVILCSITDSQSLGGDKHCRPQSCLLEDVHGGHWQSYLQRMQGKDMSYLQTDSPISPSFSQLFKRQYTDGKRPRLEYSQPQLGLAEPSSRWQVESLSLWSDVEITCRGQISRSIFREQPQFLQASCSLLSREPGVTRPAVARIKQRS